MIEILVVISIIIILAGMTLAAAGFLQRMAAENRTKAQIKLIESALTQYNADWGFYPPRSAGPIPADWFDKSDSNRLKKPNGKLYLDWTGNGYDTDGGDCLDAFDEPIYYKCPGEMNTSSVDIWSKGYDQEHGEAGSGDDIADAQTASEDNDDICNWKRNM